MLRGVLVMDNIKTAIAADDDRDIISELLELKEFM